MKWTISGLTAVLFLASAASADPWKDESGKHRWKNNDGGYAELDRDDKEEFWVGNCKVERKWEADGSYKEERKCEPPWD